MNEGVWAFMCLEAACMGITQEEGVPTRASRLFGHTVVECFVPYILGRGFVCLLWVGGRGCLAGGGGL